jgi:hypothetical protein
MQPDDQQIESLILRVQKAGRAVIHLPYTRAFEDLCAASNPKPSIADKHKIWERVLDRQSHAPSEDLSTGALTPSADALPIHPTVAFTSNSTQSQGSLSSFSGSLFEERSVSAAQPWTTPAGSVLSPEQQQEREQMLANVANSNLSNMELRVAYLLSRFPETRDSDIALGLRYWRRFQADVLERWVPLELEVLFELDKLETISRIRRHIQNELCLFRGMEQTKQNRELFQMELHQYLAAHDGALPEVRFYLDETGNEGDKAYAGVAGLCIMNWQQYEKHHAALVQWRARQNWPETIHFAETGADRVDRAVRLLAELQQRRSGLLFLGYALGSRGRTHEDLFSLFIQLMIDSLHHAKREGCLGASRSLRIVKEADPGFDSIFLDKMHKQLSDLVALEFPGQIIVQPIEAMTKGREVFLECADLIAGGMQRRALYKGRNPKDKLAEAVVNVTGFEDATDDGAVFKFFPAHP